MTAPVLDVRRLLDPPDEPPGTPDIRGDGHEQLTVLLSDASAKAWRAAARCTGDTLTDTVNRALQVYAYLVDTQDRGGDILTRKLPAAAEATVLRFS
ncbi:hypothetical protein [Amycolatopsis sp. NPDC004079]|uniref:hypothetical protein n=1 Tax=Amycolatopsis sp. NPDC004079 TaxID=3154549 RepID=UPI0033BCDF78